MKHAALLAAATLLALRAAPARADEAACRAAYVDTQRLQRSGLLRAARGAALTCGQDACSPTVRSSCAGWLEEIERAQPTIVIDARGRGGAVLTDVRVEADGQLLTERLTGRALEVDPGESLLRFTCGERRVEQRTLIHEGEKYRTLLVQFEDEAAPASQVGSGIVNERSTPGAIAAGAAEPATPASQTPGAAAPAVGAISPGATPAAGAIFPGAAPAAGAVSPGATPAAGAISPGAAAQPGEGRVVSAVPPAAPPPAPAISPIMYALGGLGVAGIGTFAILAASGYTAEEHLRDTCEGSCSSHAVSSVRRRYVFADAALGVGVTSLLVLGAVWLWPSAPADRPPQLDGEHADAPSVSAQLRLGPAGLDVTGEF